MERQNLSSADIRKRFLAFFEKRGHAILPSASLVPENDPSVLFNTAGMQPLVPYLMGQKHPLGNRLVNVQKCVRTQDIEEVGDNTHDTFFEMLGNWSLGDYFKEDAINWSYEFLTSKEEGLGLDPQGLYVTVFEGDENAPRDEESYAIWKDIFEKNNITGERIYFMSAKSNWWSVGDDGPCGPDTEMFYDLTGTHMSGLTKDEYIELDEKQEVVEIWNDVFMEYEKKDGKVVGKLNNKNVDTGSGLERVVMAVQGKTNIFGTDLFSSFMDYIQANTKGEWNMYSARVIADHIRTATFLVADGVVPSNKDRGYILRRLIRRALMQGRKIGLDYGVLVGLRSSVAAQYESLYPELAENSVTQHEVFKTEVEKFNKTLDSGLKEFEKGVDPFILATTYGFPIELTEELAAEKGITIDRAKFDAEMKSHQDLSRSGSEQKFKGGLGGTSDKIVRSHTAHHLLLAALRQVLGEHVHQRGSNITDERIRIDFAHDAKMTDKQKSAVEKLVNEWIQEDKPMQRVEMPRDQAEKIGAEMEFGVKYPDMVSVYFIGDNLDSAISKEFCGGPHIEHTGLIGTFKIQKEEASSAGVRRIKATIE